MKKFAVCLAVVLLIAAGAAYFLHTNLDSIVKAAIEKYGTQAAQTEVSVDDVSISIAAGEGSIHGLTLANPKGFSKGNALSLGLVSVKLDTGSIAGSGPIIIREIVADRAQVNFEAGATGGSNLQAIERNTTADAGASGRQPGRKVIIDNLYIRNGQIGVSHPLLQGRSLMAILPTVHLTNIGKAGGGATYAQVADQVLKSIMANANATAMQSLPKNLDALKNIKNTAPKNLGNQVRGLLRR